MLSVLHDRPFALLWVGRTVSRLGDGIYAVAVAWWLVQHATGLARGQVLVAGVVPTLLLLVVGGVAVDRLPRIAVLLGCDAIRGLAVATAGVLAQTGRLDLVGLVVVAIVSGMCAAFFYPASQAAVPDLVPPVGRPAANSLNRISAELAGICGPPLGALAIAVGGTGAAFLADAATFAVSGAAVTLILRSTAVRRPAPAAGSVVTDLAEGLRTVIRTPWLWVTIAIAGVSNLTLAAPEAVSLPFLVSRTLHGTALQYAIVTAGTAAGSVAVAIVLGRSKRRRRRGVTAYAGWLVAAAAVSSMGLRVGAAGVVVAATVFGAGIAVLELVWVSTLQDLVPPGALGRVASVDALGSYALLPVGYALAGWATDRLGPPHVLVAGGLLSAAIIGLGLLHPRVRDVD